MIFDVLVHDGERTMALPYAERRPILEGLTPEVFDDGTGSCRRG